MTQLLAPGSMCIHIIRARGELRSEDFPMSPVAGLALRIDRINQCR